MGAELMIEALVPFFTRPGANVRRLQEDADRMKWLKCISMRRQRRNFSMVSVY